MKRIGSDWWKLFHDDFWDSEAVRRMPIRSRAAFLYLLGVQAKHGHLPEDPRTIASLCSGLFPNFLRWDWPHLEAHFPVAEWAVDSPSIEGPSRVHRGRINPRQALHTASIDSRRAVDASRKALSRARKAGGHADVTALGEERRGEESIPPVVHPLPGVNPHAPAKPSKRKRSEPIDPATVALPSQIDTPAVRAELVAWVARRAEERHPPLGPVGFARAIAQIAPRGAAFAAQALGIAADKGWRGLRADWIEREMQTLPGRVNGHAPHVLPSIATSAAYQRWTPPEVRRA